MALALAVESRKRFWLGDVLALKLFATGIEDTLDLFDLIDKPLKFPTFGIGELVPTVGIGELVALLIPSLAFCNCAAGEAQAPGGSRSGFEFEPRPILITALALAVESRMRFWLGDVLALKLLATVDKPFPTVVIGELVTLLTMSFGAELAMEGTSVSSPTVGVLTRRPLGFASETVALASVLPLLGVLSS